jgi:hypothetical protein
MQACCYLTRCSLGLSLIPKEARPFSITNGIDSKMVNGLFFYSTLDLLANKVVGSTVSKSNVAVWT